MKDLVLDRHIEVLFCEGLSLGSSLRDNAFEKAMVAGHIALKHHLFQIRQFSSMSGPDLHEGNLFLLGRAELQKILQTPQLLLQLGGAEMQKVL